MCHGDREHHITAAGLKVEEVLPVRTPGSQHGGINPPQRSPTAPGDRLNKAIY